jgi:hypothetical protein
MTSLLAKGLVAQTLPIAGRVATIDRRASASRNGHHRPMAKLKTARVWDWNDIEAWARATGRLE